MWQSIDSVWSCIWPNSNGTDDHRIFCWNGWHFVDKLEFADSCDNYLKSGPESVIPNNFTRNYTPIPGECINPNQDFIVCDHNITNETSLVVDVLVGTAQVINNDECKCKIYSRSNIDKLVQCNEQHVLLLPSDIDSADYTKDTSQIMIHPSKFPGITVYVEFNSCEYGELISTNQGCICEPQTYSKVCTKDSPSSCTTCFNVIFNSNCTSYSNGMGMCGSCNDTGYGVAINSPYYICTECLWYGGAYLCARRTGTNANHDDNTII